MDGMLCQKTKQAEKDKSKLVLEKRIHKNTKAKISLTNNLKLIGKKIANTLKPIPKIKADQ